MIQYLFIALSLVYSTLAFSQNVRTFIPENCKMIAPAISQETQRIMKQYDHPGYFGALVEHESCISLKHSRCCSPKSTFKTARETGAGIGMLTVAYHADGRVRFDALADTRKKYSSELKDLTWSNILTRPDLQARALVLLFKDGYDRFPSVKDSFERTKMADSAYNGGVGAVLKARTACGLAKYCDPQLWKGHVDRYINKSRKPLYAGRSALDINLHHVDDVTVVRYKKYDVYYRTHFDEPASF